MFKMEVHKNEDVLLGTHLTSSLRRKSCLMESALPSTLSENNDEAERLALRREIDATIAQAKNVSGNEKRRSLGLSFVAQISAPEITNHISECIKLNTNNKINVKNAFSLEIIDFMTYMIRKKDANISNLQVASTSLDVSTKIYGFRVDSIHTEIMKMSGGLDRQEDENQTDDINNGQKNEAHDLQKQGKKKKKKSKQNIFSTPDSLKGTIEIMKPSLWIMEDQDLQTTDKLHQVRLTNHANSKFYLHLYNDVCVDTIEHKISSENIKIAVPRLENFLELEICPPLINFEFHGWTGDNEEEETKSVPLEEDNQNKFQFDLDASLLSEDEVIHNSINYLEVQDEEENVEKCTGAQKPAKKIEDLCTVVSKCVITKTSEYSFLQKNINIHWAGPSHWRINNFTNLSGRSKIIETCPQKPTTKKKEIEINYDDDTKKALMEKFVSLHPAKTEAAKAHWMEERFTLPWDMHYNIECATKLYLHRLMGVSAKKTNQLNITHVSDIEDYDYNNENDTSDYCPNVPIEDYETNEGNNNDNECDFRTEDEPEAEAFAEGNLVAAPKLTNKVSIAYSVQPKRIDMRQLKRSIWKSLTLKTESITIQNAETQNATEGEEKVNENKYFSRIYKTLPNMLTKTNAEALSFPISFVSLLHLANEKTLKIQSLPDMSDIIVEAS